MSTMADSATAHPFKYAACLGRRHEVESRVYRVGTAYPYRDPVESIASAVAGLLTAQHRLAFPGRGAVARVNWWWLTERIVASSDPWATALTLLRGPVPLEDGSGTVDPVAVYVNPQSADELAQAVIHGGPVALYTPWPGWFERVSSEYGVHWLGPDGRNLDGPWWSEVRRAVLVKGASYRYRAVRVQDDRDSGRPDLWLPLRALNGLLQENAQAVGVAL